MHSSALQPVHLLTAHVSGPSVGVQAASKVNARPSVGSLRDHMNVTWGHIPYPIMTPICNMDDETFKGHLVLKVRDVPWSLRICVVWVLWLAFGSCGLLLCSKQLRLGDVGPWH